jgi:hypothetical protein
MATVRWISETESNWVRRTLLVVFAPVFIAWNLSVILAATAAWLVLFFVWSVPKAIIRSLWVVGLSFCLRWNNAKPKGEDDWVSERIARANGENKAETSVHTWSVRVREGEGA